MLYYLFNWLDTLNFPGAGLFDYISFRASMALIFSLIISVGIGKRIIQRLAAQQIGETATRLGISPETARDMIIRGQAYAGGITKGGILRKEDY